MFSPSISISPLLPSSLPPSLRPRLPFRSRLPEVDVPGLEDEVVDQAVHDTAPLLHLPPVGALDQGLRVVGRPAVKPNSLLVVETLFEQLQGGGRATETGVRYLTASACRVKKYTRRTSRANSFLRMTDILPLTYGQIDT